MKVKIKSLGLAHFFKQCMLLLHHPTDHRNKHFISNHLSEECLLENSTQQQRLQNELLLFKFLPFSEEKLLENSTEKKITKLNETCWKPAQIPKITNTLTIVPLHKTQQMHVT